MSETSKSAFVGIRTKGFKISQSQTGKLPKLEQSFMSQRAPKKHSRSMMRKSTSNKSQLSGMMSKSHRRSTQSKLSTKSFYITNNFLNFNVLGNIE